MLAPIILFVYNRPLHTQKVLDALANNKLSESSQLYVFSDGPKLNISNKILDEINKIREIIRSETRFLKVHVYESEINKGLSKSIIEGVNLVFESHKNAIILEDDIVPEIGFLKYMNDALLMYENIDEVGCIHAWNYTFNKNLITKSTFLLKGADCWGWATWKNSWDLFESDGIKLYEQINSAKLNYAFDRNGTIPFCKMLLDQIEGKNDSWAIRWHASLFLLNKFCVQPKYPIVKNIGFDGTGTHCGTEQIYQVTTKFINLKRHTSFEEDNRYFKSFELGLLNKSTSFVFYFIKSFFYQFITKTKKNR